MESALRFNEKRFETKWSRSYLIFARTSNECKRYISQKTENIDLKYKKNYYIIFNTISSEEKPFTEATIHRYSYSEGRSSENTQQIYRRAPMPNCDFN